MKKIKWNSLFITCLLCAAPILFGISIYQQLPAKMAIHFQLNNLPDRYASKNFALFGLPLLMAALQAFCCIMCDIQAAAKGSNRKLELATKAIVPVLSVILYLITVFYAMGKQIDVRRIVMLLVGGIMIVIGNYLPKGSVGSFPARLNSSQAKKINRFLGYGTVMLGMIFWITILLPPIYSALSLFLLIPYTLIDLIYTLHVQKQKESKQ